MFKAKNNKNIKNLMDAILLLKNSDEARRFFRDLLTEKELKEFGNRWKAAKMLSKNVTYTKIEKETGLSSTTVARISKWLNNGKNGYNLIINRIESSVNHHSQLLVGKGLR